MEDVSRSGIFTFSQFSFVVMFSQQTEILNMYEMLYIPCIQSGWFYRLYVLHTYSIHTSYSKPAEYKFTPTKGRLSIYQLPILKSIGAGGETRLSWLHNLLYLS